MVNQLASYSYHEPGILTLLVLASFFLVLNAVSYALDYLVYCGLLGQILIGVWFGTPGTGWLSSSVQNATEQLGYIGLILLIYEGGLNTNLASLRKNLPLSCAVAVTGIGTPIALSYILQSMLDISALQAFAAGAALCSTSLGTTFTVLSTSGLVESRLGVVLTSAAVLDDVVGLVILKIISALGSESSGFNAMTVVRPVLVSLAFAVLLPAICARLIAPLIRCAARRDLALEYATLFKTVASDQGLFVLHTLFLIGMFTGATYAGTTGLFAAYLTGVCVSWLDTLYTSIGSMQATARPVETSTSAEVASADGVTSQTQHQTRLQHDRSVYTDSRPTGLQIYKRFYQPSVDAILKPLFFASIGFAIPITEMFAGPIVWRGVVYAILMVLGKLACGVWLIGFPSMMPSALGSLKAKMMEGFRGLQGPHCQPKKQKSRQPRRRPTPSQNTPTQQASTDQVFVVDATPGHSHAPKSSLSAQPRSLYPAAILGFAMVARGEIGFLISAIAHSSGILTNELFLAVTWAIFMCTFIGPLVVGVLVRRVRRLQDEERMRRTGRKDPLGVWGFGKT